MPHTRCGLRLVFDLSNTRLGVGYHMVSERDNTSRRSAEGHQEKCPPHVGMSYRVNRQTFTDTIEGGLTQLQARVCRASASNGGGPSADSLDNQGAVWSLILGGHGSWLGSGA